MAAPRRSPLWSIVAPIALIGVFALAVLLVLGALEQPPPRAEVEPPAASTAAPAPLLDASVPATYRIRKGDTLSDIAERYGLTTDWILSLNPQLDPTGLPIGERINLRQPAAP